MTYKRTQPFFAGKSSLQISTKLLSFVSSPFSPSLSIREMPPLRGYVTGIFMSRRQILFNSKLRAFLIRKMVLDLSEEDTT